jgi:hypothetical protein
MVKLLRQMAWRVTMSKKISTMFSQDPLVGGEAQRDLRVACQPGVDRGVFVGAVVVTHQV